MPELPDVEVRRKYLERNALGRPIAGISVSDPRSLEGVTPAALGRGLKGASFTAARRRAKYTLLPTDRGNTVLMHYGMTGDVLVRSKGEPRPRFNKVEFHFTDGGALDFSDIRLFGKIALYPTTDEDEIPDVAHLGPEPLGRSFTFKVFRGIVRNHRITIHQLLMDQSLIAGIGNIFSDEICYQAGVRPDRNTSSLTDVEIHRLFDKTRWVLRRAIALDADLDGHADEFIIPNRVKGGRCPHSGDLLVKKTIGGRSSYYCPKCQK
jgi:formamidopyrimidine-DNA glycosylase